MAGQNEPINSRNVTLTKNEPGKPNGWREREAEKDYPGAKQGDGLQPADSRLVTEEGIPEPGEETGWRAKEARGKEPDTDRILPSRETPPGVPEEGRPFTAEEAAEGNRPA